MSVSAMAWAWKQTTGSPVAKVLLVTLASCADYHGEAWPTRAQLASDCEMSEATVDRHLSLLERAGLIYCGAPRGIGRVRHYVVLADAICVAHAEALAQGSAVP